MVYSGRAPIRKKANESIPVFHRGQGFKVGRAKAVIGVAWANIALLPIAKDPAPYMARNHLWQGYPVIYFGWKTVFSTVDHAAFETAFL